MHRYYGDGCFRKQADRLFAVASKMKHFDSGCTEHPQSRSSCEPELAYEDVVNAAMLICEYNARESLVLYH